MTKKNLHSKIDELWDEYEALIDRDNQDEIIGKIARLNIAVKKDTDGSKNAVLDIMVLGYVLQDKGKSV